ncbi:MAG: DUF885 domain-containing protein [Myxococcota bacterium]
MNLIQGSIRPALKNYLEFLTVTYLPKARSEVGVSNNPAGAACYQAQIRYHTDVNKTADEIHRIGIEELARLRSQMLTLAESEGYGSIGDYFAALKEDKSQYVQNRQQLVDHNRALVDKATDALPQAFGILPKAPIEVTPIESFREKDAPAAYYYSAADDGTRPAQYFINTYKPETRPLYNMEALAYHEAVPGHHLQIAIAQALRMPDIRRHTHFTSYVEGWALYAELVADELGLYSSAATKLGMLNYQAWRAARLVVDTGMHALGWTRQQAIDFMKDKLVLPESEIVNEIDRYIIWPGQALAYMMGRMEIQALRRTVEAKQGSTFDRRKFHDVVLENGAVPLGVLRELVSDAFELNGSPP